MLILGPDVSFNGSPTVSPTTAAACGPEPFPKNCLVLSIFLSISKSDAVIFNLPAKKYYLFNLPSMYFLQLSQAPPEFEDEMAICTPETITPAR